MTTPNNRRPAPRRSSLAGSSPVAPPAAEPAEDEQPEAPPRRPSSRTRRDQDESKQKYPPKVTFYQHREDTARVRGAILHTMATEGSRSLSQFVNDAVMAKVEELEKQYNGGKPFPPVGANEMPQGRPMGE